MHSPVASVTLSAAPHRWCGPCLIQKPAERRVPRGHCEERALRQEPVTGWLSDEAICASDAEPRLLRRWPRRREEPGAWTAPRNDRCATRFLNVGADRLFGNPCHSERVDQPTPPPAILQRRVSVLGRPRTCPEGNEGFFAVLAVPRSTEDRAAQNDTEKHL